MRISRYIFAAIITLVFSMSVFASEPSTGKLSAEYNIIAGDTYEQFTQGSTSEMAYTVTESFSLVTLERPARKPDKEIYFNYKDAKVLNDAKMQNQNFDRVSFYLL